VTNYFSRISQKVSYEVEKVSYEVEKVSYEVQKVSYRKMIFWNQFSSFAQYEKLSYRVQKVSYGVLKVSFRRVQKVTYGDNWVPKIRGCARGFFACPCWVCCSNFAPSV
jgi:hypothetical protein